MIPPRLCPSCGQKDTVEPMPPGSTAGNQYCACCSLVFQGSDLEWEKWTQRRRKKMQELALEASGLPDVQTETDKENAQW